MPILRWEPAQLDVVQQDVPRWGLASSATAAVLLFAGWTAAAALQVRPYSPVRQTVSVLAAHGASDRWLMTLAFLVVGGCDVITGLAVRPAARPGRVILIAGGLAGVLVGLNPETLGAGGSWRHLFFAAVGFVTLTIWPLAATRRPRSAGEPGQVPWALRLRNGTGASIVTLALFAWFTAELLAHGRQLGLAERALGEMQALWPLIVVLSCLASAGRDREPPSRLRAVPERAKDLFNNKIPRRRLKPERLGRGA